MFYLIKNEVYIISNGGIIMHTNSVQILPSYEAFKKMQNENNYTVLINVMIISFVIESIFFFFICVIFKDYESLYFDSFERYFANYWYYMIVYVILVWAMIKFFYKAPELFGVVCITFILIEKIMMFTVDYKSLFALVFWSILVLILSFNYIGPKVVNNVIVLSFVVFVFMLLENKIDTKPFILLLWLMFVVLLIGCISSSRIFSSKLMMFMYHESLEKEKENALKLLNYDVLTGAMSKHALSKYIEKTFLQSYINYTSLFNAGEIVAIVWLPEPEWPIGYVTENIFDVLGYTNEELLFDIISYKKIIHLEDLKKIEIENRAHIKAKDDHFEYKYRLQKKDGTYIWVRNYCVPVWNHDVLIQTNGYIYDIDSEMEAKELIYENSQKLDDIIEATGVGSWEWDCEKSQLKGNLRLAKILKLELNEVNHLSYSEILNMIFKEDLESRSQLIRNHKAGKSDFYGIEYRVQCRSGEYLWVYERGRVVKWSIEGKALKLVGTLIDITDMKEKNSRLQHSEKLNALGRLSGGIAHDINNQLMMLRSLLDLSKEQDNIENYRAHNNAMILITEHAADTLKQLLTFTKHHMYKPIILNLNQMIKEFVIVIEHTFQKDLVIETQITEEVIFINADKALIENAFINLCINAKEAMEPGGKLIVKLNIIELFKETHTFTGILEAGKYAQVEFIDHGEGIEPENLDKIFEPFYTTKETGNGIGLSTVVSSIKEHNGGINVYSEKNKGTKFCIGLPIVERNQEILSNTEQRSQLNEIMPKIMIVDDEPVIVGVMAQFLEMKGCEVITFTNPKKAILYYKEYEKDINIVLLDILMPEMEGTEVLGELVKINQEVKVLFLSGYSQGVEIKVENQSNIIGFIQKPVRLETIYSEIINTINDKIDSRAKR